MKKMAVTRKKDGSKKKLKTTMQRLASYTFMFAGRACNVDTGLLKASNVMAETPTGFVIQNAAVSPKNGYAYARAVHNGHGGPIPYKGNPWMRRGLVSALKMLGVKNLSVREN